MLKMARRRPGRNIVARATNEPKPLRLGSPSANPNAKPLLSRVKHMLKKRRANLDVQNPLSASILQGPILRHLARPIDELRTEVE